MSSSQIAYARGAWCFLRRWLRVALWFFLVLNFNFASAALHDSSDPFRQKPNLRQWSDVLDADYLQKIEEFGSKIPDIIFDSINQWNTRLYGNTQFNLNLSVSREVFENGGQRGTWSVVDHFGINTGIPLFQASVPLPSGLNPLGFFIGVNGAIEVTNVRQMRPNLLPSVESSKNRMLRVSDSVKQQRYLNDQQERMRSGESLTSKGWVEGLNELGDRILMFLPMNGLNFSRYSRLLNLALVPFKLPLNKKLFDQLENEEVVSYLGQGAAEFGISTGWNLDPSGLTGVINAGVSVSTYLRGVYRITVMKVSENTARVRVTRTQSVGNQMFFGGGYAPGLLDAIIVVNGLSGFLRIYPFQLSRNVDSSRVFEQAYEYDLSQASGRLAYEKAVLGSFKLSDELSMNREGRRRDSTQETGVIRVLEEQTQSRTQQFSRNLQLGFLFRMSQSGVVTDSVTTVTQRDGKKRTLSAYSQNSQEWSTVFAQYQKSQHLFNISVDLDECERLRSSCDEFSMDFEGRFEGTNTSQADLFYSLLELENSVGQSEVIPRTPMVREIRSLRRDLIRPWVLLEPGSDLRASRFFYQIQLDSDLLSRFVNYPESQMWRVLETAFHIPTGSWSNSLFRFFYYFSRLPVTLVDLPLNLFQVNLSPGTNLYHAQSFRARWAQIKTVRSPRDRAGALANLLNDPFYGVELTQILRAVLAGSVVPYRFEASNQVFGVVQGEGKTELLAQNIATDRVLEVDWKRKDSDSELDSDLEIRSLQLNETRVGSTRVVSFYLPASVRQIYVEVYSLGPVAFPMKRFLGSKVIASEDLRRGEVWEKGFQHLILDPGMAESPFFGVVQRFRSKERYLIRMAASRDRVHWGRVVELKIEGR